MLKYNTNKTTHYTNNLSITLIINYSSIPKILCIFSFIAENFGYKTRVVQLVRTLISCINNENSNFSPGTSY